MKYVLIPVKSLDRAKRRLAGLLAAEERAALAGVMLEHVFTEVARARGYDRVAVVTRYEPALVTARRFGFETIVDAEEVSESASVDYASGVIAARGGRSVLRLPIDLPLLRAEDVEVILGRVSSDPSAVIVPSRDRRGTNALARTPPTLFPSHFGPGSLSKHLTEARRRTVPCEVLDLPRVAFDLDEPADISLLLEQAGETVAGRFLNGLTARR